MLIYLFKPVQNDPLLYLIVASNMRESLTQIKLRLFFRRKYLVRGPRILVVPREPKTKNGQRRGDSVET